MRDLDGRLPGRRVAIEREEPVATVGVDGRLHRARVDLDRRQLGERDPTARVRRPLAECHEPEEELADGFPAAGLSGRVQVLGAGGEGPADAPDLTVRLEREAPVVASIVELGERVLDERQGAGLLRDVRRDLRDERAVDLEARMLRRPDDRPLELLGRQGAEDLGARPEQLAHPRIAERPVVEVGAERGDHAHPARRVRGRDPKALEEQRPVVLVLGERERLLELVDDHQELGAVGDDRIGHLEETSRSRLEATEEIRGGTHGDPHERVVELLERMVPGVHLGDEPGVGARDRAAADRRHQTGPDRRGLPAPARPDDGDEPRRLTDVGKAIEQPLDERLPTEEVEGVGLEERPQALVRVPRPGDDGRPAVRPRPQDRGELGEDRRVVVGSLRDLRATERLTERPSGGARRASRAPGRRTLGGRPGLPPSRSRWRSP